MKKITVLSLILLLSVQWIDAQVTEGEAKLRKQTIDTIQGWRTGGVTALNFSQTSLVNWAAGGENTFAANGLFSVFANYKQKSAAWDNSLDIGYGLLRQGDKKAFIKTDDKIDFLSKYGQKAFNNWYYAALINFKTQMTEGFKYPNDSVKISDLFAPAYILSALGMDNKPNKYWSLFIAPLTSKITIVNDEELANAGAFGVEKAVIDDAGNIVTPGEKLRSEFGGYVRIIFSKNDFKQELLKNVAFTSKLDLFSNYLHNPQNIDINWETQLAFKINKFFSVNINTHLVYDDDIKIASDKLVNGLPKSPGPKTQYKQILGLGFSYKF